MRAVLLLSFRNIARHRLRFLLTTFSVLLGVSFVVASFVLTDGLRSTFNSLISEGFEETDLQVQARGDFDEIMFTYRAIDEDLYDVVSTTEGVEQATPYTREREDRGAVGQREAHPVVLGADPLVQLGALGGEQDDAGRG